MKKTQVYFRSAYTSPVLAACAFAFAPSANAQSVWAGSTNNQWSNPANWRDANIPVPGGDLIIANATSNGLLLNDGSKSIGSVTFGDQEPLRVSTFNLNTGQGSQLTIAGGITADGEFTNGQFNLRGHIVISTPQTWRSGGSAGPGDHGIYFREIANGNNTAGHPDRGTLRLNADVAKTGPGKLVIAGTTLSGEGNLTIESGTFKFNAGQSHLLTVEGPGSLIVGNDALLAIYKNSGTLDIRRPIVMNDFATFSTRNGIVDIASPVTWNGEHSLEVINPAGSHTTFTGPWYGAGTILRTGERTLNLDGDLSGFTGELHLTSSGVTNINTPLGGSLIIDWGGVLGNEAEISGDLHVDWGGGTIITDPDTPGGVHVGGDLILDGLTSIQVTHPPATSAPFVVLTYDGDFTGGLENLVAEGFAPSSAVFSIPQPGVITLSIQIAGDSLTWTGQTDSFWDMVTANWKDSAGNPKIFNTSDDVLFDDGGDVLEREITIDGQLSPASITVDTATGYTITGTGGITGSGGLVKKGPGDLSFGGGNTFTGGVAIEAGSLITVSNQALGANGQVITVKDGATLNFNGQNNANRNYHASIAGAGAAGQGAIINTGGGGNFGFGHITLDDDATIGGTGRWDLRPSSGNHSLGASLDLGGHTLTKTGTNIVAFVDSVIDSDGSIHVNQGRLNFSRNILGGAGSLDINPGTTVWFENYTQPPAGYSLPPQETTKAINIDSGTLHVLGSTADFRIDSAIGISGTATLSTASNLNLTNTVSGTGEIRKTGTAALILDLAPGWTGNTTVAEGTLTLNAAGLDDGGGVSLGEGAVLNLAHGQADTVKTLLLNGVPAAAGTWGSSTSGAANPNDTFFQGDGILNVLEASAPGDAFAVWAASHGLSGGDALPGADPDKDGIPNGIEFVIGGLPAPGSGSNSSHLLPTPSLDGTHLNFVFRRTDASVPSDPHVEYGGNLAGWTRAQNGTNRVTIEAPAPVEGEAGVSTITVRIPRALATDGRIFARLRVDIP